MKTYHRIIQRLALVALAILNAQLSSALAQTDLCNPSNTVKFVQMPDIYAGLDVFDTRTIVLADDFLCNSQGPITDILLWGSWLSDQVGTITNFWLGIFDDVPAVSGIPSHPGTNLLWSQSFGANQFSQGYYTNGSETFFNPTNSSVMGWDSQVYYYCFSPTNPFVQNGTITSRTNYWLAVCAQVAGTNLFGWKTCLTNYNYGDAAVWAPANKLAQPKSGASWTPIININTLQPVNLSFILSTTNPPACCPETNGVKYAQYPDLINGVDVDASFYPYDMCWTGLGWVLADDFPCTNSGPITDIHLWGSWYNDQVDPNAVFTLAIWSDVPTNAVSGFSHPGIPLWSQSYTNGQYGLCLVTNAELFEDGRGMPITFPDCNLYTWTTNLYHLCFAVPPPSNPNNTFCQTGTATAPTNCWLSVTVQGTNYFGWKSSATAYNDYAVGSSSGNFFPTNWDTIIYKPGGYPGLNMAFMIGMATNQCTGPQLLCSTQIFGCSDPWQPPIPGIFDPCPCCPSNGVPYLASVATNSYYCPTVIQYNWLYTNCLGQTAACSSYVIVTSAPPVFACSNITITCGSPFPTNPPAVTDPCCSNLVPFLVAGPSTNGNGCTNTIVRVWEARDCYCTNLTATCTQTVTILPSPPTITCSTNITVVVASNPTNLATLFRTNPLPVGISRSGNNVTLTWSNSVNWTTTQVTYAAPTVSGCGCPPFTTNCVPPSGSMFPVGTNTVTCTATDNLGQTANCTFTVTVSVSPAWTYSIYRTNNLYLAWITNWPRIVTGYPAGGSTAQWISYTDTVPAGTTTNYYRVRVDVPPVP